MCFVLSPSSASSICARILQAGSEQRKGDTENINRKYRHSTTRCYRRYSVSHSLCKACISIDVQRARKSSPFTQLFMHKHVPMTTTMLDIHEPDCDPSFSAASSTTTSRASRFRILRHLLLSHTHSDVARQCFSPQPSTEYEATKTCRIVWRWRGGFAHENEFRRSHHQGHFH